MNNPVIYKITSPSNKVYIGQSWNIMGRVSKYKTGHCLHQPKICNSIKKYGWNSHLFEIIHELPIDIEQEVLDRYEQIYIDQYRNCNIELMNIREGGSRGKHSEETKKKLTGKKHSQETKDKLRIIATGKKLRPMTDEEKRTKSLAALGRKNSKAHVESMRKANIRDYISGKRKKVFGENHWNTVLTKNKVIEIINKYKTKKYTQKLLAQEYNISASYVSNIINNKARLNG